MTKEQLEEKMGIIISRIAENNRIIRQAKKAEQELERLRWELTQLALEYSQIPETERELRVVK